MPNRCKVIFKEVSLGTQSNNTLQISLFGVFEEQTDVGADERLRKAQTQMPSARGPIAKLGWGSGGIPVPLALLSPGERMKSNETERERRNAQTTPRTGPLVSKGSLGGR